MLSTKLDYIAQLLWEAGISNWVVSPGSRNAPIVAALLKHGQFNIHSSPDERSGAFIALGISQIHQYPAGFICGFFILYPLLDTTPRRFILYTPSNPIISTKSFSIFII
jgi:hypothetical protein